VSQPFRSPSSDPAPPPAADGAAADGGAADGSVAGAAVPPAPRSDAPAGEALRRLQERYLAAQLRGDRREALRLVDEEGLARGHSVPALHLHVIAPAQQEIGRLWQRNVIHVAQEHAATAISQLVVSHLYRHLPVQPPLGRRVLVACASGERHEMGARIASDLLESAGFAVHYLGADVPIRDLLAHAVVTRPDLVVLSAATGMCTPGLVEAVRTLRATFGPEFPVVVGGAAFDDAATAPPCDLPEGVLQHGLDGRALVVLVCDRLGLPRPPLFDLAVPAAA
jgi:methanogenic corrinoid protein MtbC1